MFDLTRIIIIIIFFISRIPTKTLQFRTSFPKKSSSSSESKILEPKQVCRFFFLRKIWIFWVSRNFFKKFFYCKNNGKLYGFLNLKISGEKIKKKEKFSLAWKLQKNHYFLAFFNFLENHTISHYFSQFRHNFFVSNANIISYYFSLLDLFTAGKFWQLRTIFLGFETKIG